VARDGRSDRFDRDRFGDRGRLRLATFAVAGASLALFGPCGSTTTASAARPGAQSAAALSREPLVSPQYQAKTADIAAKAGSTGPAADQSGGGIATVAAASDPPRRRAQRPLAIEQTGLPAAAWYRVRKARYQWRYGIQHAIRAIQNTMPSVLFLANRDRKPDQIITQTARGGAQSQHPRLISSAVRPNDRVADARLLLRLGLALGLAYLVFLVAWFWGTRDRRHGVERVVRF
jgi:hypothetical protein